MTSFFSGRLRAFTLAGLVLAFVAVYPAVASADSSPVAGATELTPSGQITLDRGELINPWANPAVTPASTEAPVFRPAVDAATYAQLKAAAATAAAQGREGAGPSRGNVIGNLFGFTGIQQGVAPNPCGCFPPDVNAAVGPSQILAIANSQIAVFSKLGVPLAAVSINTFFGYAATLLFDPRVLYDRYDNRWVIEAEGFPETATGPQFQFFAVSTSGNAAGAYRKFAINMSAVIGAANFWDYPQIGQNQDGLIFTGNVFTPTAFAGSRTFQFSLDSLHSSFNGGTSSFVFPLGATTTPPYVLDRNPRAHLLSVPVSGAALGHTFWNEPGHDLNSLVFGLGVVPVAAYVPPADAPQPGTAILLDTLDARMVADTYQIGDSLFATHSIAFGPAAIRWYEIDTEGAGINTLRQQQNRFRSGISSDFNASIAINNAQRMVICSSTSDTATFPSIECIGRLPTDAASTTGPFNVVFPGATSQVGNGSPVARWGDTSSVSPDTFIFSSVFWANNESVQPSGTAWSTRIQKISIT